jgi:hypothetical protein
MDSRYSRNITEVQASYLDDYLKKSKDTLSEFLEGDNSREISEWEDLGWIEYTKYDNVLWIHTAYSKKPHKETVEIWNNLKKLAKSKGCDRIHFTTRRNPKAFERLFNAKTIQYKLEVIL